MKSITCLTGPIRLEVDAILNLFIPVNQPMSGRGFGSPVVFLQKPHKIHRAKNQVIKNKLTSCLTSEWVEFYFLSLVGQRSKVKSSLRESLKADWSSALGCKKLIG